METNRPVETETPPSPREKLLIKAQIAQEIYWECVSEVEAEFDIELDGEDLSELSVSDLEAMNKEQSGEGSSDVCDQCHRAGVEIARTNDDGETVCVECDSDAKERPNTPEEAKEDRWDDDRD